jgi:hypothetical protein
MLQMLDVIMFKPLLSGYPHKVYRFMKRCQSLTSMSKRGFYPLFIAVGEASFKETTISKAFGVTSLLPLNPDMILK